MARRRGGDKLFNQKKKKKNKMNLKELQIIKEL